MSILTPSPKNPQFHTKTFPTVEGGTCQATHHFVDRLLQLKGYRIVSIGLSLQEGEYYPIPVLNLERKRPGKEREHLTIYVQADPEGNGPGHLAIY